MWWDGGAITPYLSFPDFGYAMDSLLGSGWWTRWNEFVIFASRNSTISTPICSEINEVMFRSTILDSGWMYLWNTTEHGPITLFELQEKLEDLLMEHLL